jgi:hypothetical protein
MDQPPAPGNTVVLRNFWHAALLTCGLIGPLIFLVVYFTFGQVSPDFDMLRQPIGRLELVDYGWIQSANFIVFGLFTCAFAIGLRIELHRGFGVTLIPLFHILTALGMIALGLFIHEPVHTYASIFLTVSLFATFMLFAFRFAHDPRWKGWAFYSRLCALAIILLSVSYWYAHHIDSPYSGIFEHLLIITRLVWMTVFILKLLGGQRLTAIA